MGKYSEEIYDRAEKKFDSLAGQKAWLKGFYDKPSKNEAERDGASLFIELNESEDISNKLSDSDSLEDIKNIQKDIINKNFGFYGQYLESEASVKLKRQAEEIISNIGARGIGADRVLKVIEKNDYDFSKIKYHAYEVKGKQRIGLFEVGKRGFITNVPSEPREISEATPNFDFLEN